MALVAMTGTSEPGRLSRHAEGNAARERRAGACRSHNGRSRELVAMLVGHRHRSSPPIEVYRACELCGAVLDSDHLEQTADGPVCLFCGRVAPTMSERSARRDAIAVGDVLRDARIQRGIS